MKSIKIPLAKTIKTIVFFCLLIVPIGLIRGQEIDVLEKEIEVPLIEISEKLNLSKIQFELEDDRLIDIDLIEQQEEDYFEINNKYFHNPEFACLTGRCRVDEYVTPQNEKGYLVIFINDELQRISTISSGVENLTNDWVDYEKNN